MWTVRVCLSKLSLEKLAKSRAPLRLGFEAWVSACCRSQKSVVMRQAAKAQDKTRRAESDIIACGELKPVRKPLVNASRQHAGAEQASSATDILSSSDHWSSHNLNNRYGHAANLIS